MAGADMNHTLRVSQQAPTNINLPALEWVSWSAGVNYPEEWHSKDAFFKIKIRREGGRESRDRWVLQMPGVRREFPGELTASDMKAEALEAYRQRILSAIDMAA
jgi:hypothetical protein